MAEYLAKKNPNSKTRISITTKCSSLLKQHRTRLSILRRCASATMLYPYPERERSKEE
ncbi:unnamed protein product [Eruca vesicaria subsp. sativa]|uniref:Ribosomal protein L33 n=1 Tax=Eruca vesicaria subsp. sativa TaxID=29727 RepID=A0ABC8L3S5_ERUVS|nr:unnamed protein product [Eruca vesicaria subsp. sativa]